MESKVAYFQGNFEDLPLTRKSQPFTFSHLPQNGERQGGAVTSHFADWLVL